MTHATFKVPYFFWVSPPSDRVRPLLESAQNLYDFRYSPPSDTVRTLIESAQNVSKFTKFIAKLAMTPSERTSLS